MATLHESDIPGISANGAAFLAQLGTDLEQVKSAVNQLIIDFNAHTHAGITTGAGTSGASAAGTTAAPVTITEHADPNL
jgi:hypothetical protein